MKKTLVAIALSVITMALCACGGGGTTSDQYAVNPFVVEHVFFSEYGTMSVDDLGISEEAALETNPQLKEENMSDNDDVCLLVFASLNCPAEDEEDVKIPASKEDSNLPGTVLDMTLEVGGESYVNCYEYNDHDNRMTNYWKEYKSGKSLDTTNIMFAGSDEKTKVVAQFSIPYHYYKEAVENGESYILTWKDANLKYVAEYSVGDTVVKMSTKSISGSL